jgi:hypothetical protein
VVTGCLSEGSLRSWVKLASSVLIEVCLFSQAFQNGSTFWESHVQGD